MANYRAHPAAGMPHDERLRRRAAVQRRELAPWDTGHSGRSGLTDAVDVPASIVLAAHFTRLDPVCLPWGFLSSLRTVLGARLWSVNHGGGTVRAFVIRGFDKKKGVDFERVHEELIAPALTEAGIDGGDTTKVIVQAGSIHKDMFRELVMADIVVADVSLHNANVFYELGIRHAVRPRSTVLIYTKIDEIPFDLMTYRYMSYDAASPAAARPQLVQVLRETLASEDVDSPVFELLPEFAPGARTALLSLPRSLAEDIEQAREAKRAGELRLIADEVMGLRFEEAALRAVATASGQAGDDIGAQRAWERIRDVHPDDLTANQALADIYRRLGNLVLSDQALRRALGAGTLTKADRAELFAGLGSNSKRRWVKEWRDASEQNKTRAALQSQEREQSLDFYRRGFDEDRNHWYSGLNALALAKVTVQLAGRSPGDWRNRFDTNAKADRELERLTSEAAALTCTVRASIDAARTQSRRAGNANVWIEVSAADLRFLTSSEPERVTSAYQAAMSPLLSPGNRRTIREQVEMYRDLGVFTENAAPTLDLLGGPEDRSTDKIRPLVFSGHMIDPPGRVPERFPGHQEQTAKEQILEAIRAIKAVADGQGEQLIGLAGATDGGDVLFHEACAELGIDTEVFLPVPELAYRATATSGWPGWVERYHAVLGWVRERAREKNKKEDGVHILARADQRPTWLQGRAGYSTWQRSNRWILHHAWATTTVNRVTVLALWNGEPGDGPGGTADMVNTAQAGGADVIVLETGKIFGLPGPQPPPQQPEQAMAVVKAVLPPTIAGQARAVAGVDSVLREVWQKHQRWSDAADAAQRSLNRWRLSNLALLVLGAIAAAFAAQTWLVSTAAAALAAVSAAVLAAAAFIQGSMLTSDNMSRWTGARAASEALKAETCRYLAGVQPYAGPDRDKRLQTQLDTVQTRAKDLLVEEQLATPGDGKLPPVDTFERYMENRAQEQATWHRSKVEEHRKKAQVLRFCQLAATAAGAVLAAIAGALPGAHLAAWTAAATTLAAAFATHVAATQHERIAASYAATADQLERLVVGVDAKKASTDRQAQFVVDVERVLAVQNNGWVDLLSTSVKTS
jgi:SMODS and SLOG-associating 2TM effector domain 1/Protein of unknown function (DUF4231)/Tetratricopeptide Repeats-Sensor